MTGDESRVACDGLQGRTFDTAARQDLWTARGERTARVFPDFVRRRHCARRPPQDASSRAGIHGRHGIEQLACVRVQGRLNERPVPCHLDDAAAEHDHDAFAKPRDHRQVVADEEARKSAIVPDPFEEADDLALHADVEGADRFVADDEAWIEDERARDDATLELASAQLVRIARGQTRPDSDFVELRLRTSCAFLGSGARIKRPQGLGHTLDERHARVEGGMGILEYALQLAPQGAKCACAEPVDALPAPAHFAGGERHEAKYRAAERRLAAAGLADETEHLVFGDREVNILDCRYLAGWRSGLAELHRDTAQFKEIHGRPARVGTAASRVEL